MSNDPADYPEDSFDNMQRIARELDFPFPYVLDATQEVAKAYGAVCTPDFFGFNAALELQYRGRLDASKKETAPADARRDLFEAMVQVARTGHGPREQIPSMGCSIKWKAIAPAAPELSPRLAALVQTVREVAQAMIMPRYRRRCAAARRTAAFSPKSDLKAQQAWTRSLIRIVRCPVLGEEMSAEDQHALWQQGHATACGASTRSTAPPTSPTASPCSPSAPPSRRRPQRDGRRL